MTGPSTPLNAWLIASVEQLYVATVQASRRYYLHRLDAASRRQEEEQSEQARTEAEAFNVACALVKLMLIEILGQAPSAALTATAWSTPEDTEQASELSARMGSLLEACLRAETAGQLAADDQPHRVGDQDVWRIKGCATTAAQAAYYVDAALNGQWLTLTSAREALREVSALMVWHSAHEFVSGR